jgi:hypothetical protein
MGCNVRSQIADAFPVPFQPFAMAQGSSDRDGEPQGGGNDHGTAPHDDLPYRVELWNDDRTSVEQVLAVTAHSSIGYAAYFAATREYPDRYLTLSHRNRVLSRWNAKH